MRDLLSRTLHVTAPDVSIAPLGMPGQASNSDTLLAGRFPDEEAPRVVELVRESGGEIVANVDERWTKPRPAPERPHWTQTLKRDGLHA